jgi:hypothetical protein
MAHVRFSVRLPIVVVAAIVIAAFKPPSAQSTDLAIAGRHNAF